MIEGGLPGPTRRTPPGSPGEIYRIFAAAGLHRRPGGHGATSSALSYGNATGIVLWRGWRTILQEYRWLKAVLHTVVMLCFGVAMKATSKWRKIDMIGGPRSIILFIRKTK